MDAAEIFEVMIMNSPGFTLVIPDYLQFTDDELELDGLSFIKTAWRKSLLGGEKSEQSLVEKESRP